MGMVKAKFEKGIIWRRIIDATKELVKEAVFDFRADGIHMTAVEDSNMGMVKLFLDKIGFIEYDLEKSESMGYELVNFSKALSIVGINDSVDIISDGKGDFVRFLISTKTGSLKSITEFNLKLSHLFFEPLGLEASDFSAILFLPSKELLRIVNIVSLMGGDLISL